MKFLVEAQLPQHLAKELTLAGFNTLHTPDLPHGNRTRDEELVALATREDRILITKDSDFVTTCHLQQGRLRPTIRQNLPFHERAFPP
ncbi:MAG: DUF5615 family PIN-like protein [Nitrospirales bacterium]|nr:DUF5615 family PIN-like protein [Nitrospirales bacterium]MBA3964246.1 DUF5615 family PIN-like protein [Nitrospirales bacterium]